VKSVRLGFAVNTVGPGQLSLRVFQFRRQLLFRSAKAPYLYSFIYHPCYVERLCAGGGGGGGGAEAILPSLPQNLITVSQAAHRSLLCMRPAFDPVLCYL
jgi:hypothetical protein